VSERTPTKGTPSSADRIRTAAAGAVLWLLRHTPWRLRWGLANILGGVAARRHRKRRHAAQINLELAFGDRLSPAEREHIATSSFQNFIGCMFDMVAIIPRLRPDNWQHFVRVPEEDLARTRALLEQKNGMLMMLSHYGNWELLGSAMSYMGLAPVNGVAKRQSAWANPLLEKLRTHSGSRIIYKEGAARKTLGALRRGEIVGFAIDQNFSQGIFVPFFGVEAATADTLAGLARASGAPIVPMTCLPNGDGTYSARLLPAVPVVCSDDKAADILQITRNCLEALEGIIRERPEYWLWSHKRWKARPPHEHPRLNLYEAATSTHSTPAAAAKPSAPTSRSAP